MLDTQPDAALLHVHRTQITDGTELALHTRLEAAQLVLQLGQLAITLAQRRPHCGVEMMTTVDGVQEALTYSFGGRPTSLSR